MFSDLFCPKGRRERQGLIMNMTFRKVFSTLAIAAFVLSTAQAVRAEDAGDLGAASTQANTALNDQISLLKKQINSTTDSALKQSLQARITMLDKLKSDMAWLGGTYGGAQKAVADAKKAVDDAFEEAKKDFEDEATTYDPNFNLNPTPAKPWTEKQRARFDKKISAAIAPKEAAAQTAADKYNKIHAEFSENVAKANKEKELPDTLKNALVSASLDAKLNNIDLKQKISSLKADADLAKLTGGFTDVMVKQRVTANAAGTLQRVYMQSVVEGLLSSSKLMCGAVSSCAKGAKPFNPNAQQDTKDALNSIFGGTKIQDYLNENSGEHKDQKSK